jgi:hypothetical protein
MLDMEQIFEQIETAMPGARSMTRVTGNGVVNEWHAVLLFDDDSEITLGSGEPAAFDTCIAATRYAHRAKAMLIHQKNGTEPTLFRAESEYSLMMIICPSYDYVEKTLEQYHIPIEDFTNVCEASLFELASFCDRGFRPLVYQSDLDGTEEYYEVYYIKEHAGRLPDDYAFTPGETHVHVCSILAKSPDDVFHKMQGLNWSPNGEARPLIQALETHHTSMSVGDVVVSPAGFAWMCAPVGWEKVDNPIQQVDVADDSQP